MFWRHLHVDYVFVFVTLLLSLLFYIFYVCCYCCYFCNICFLSLSIYSEAYKHIYVFYYAMSLLLLLILNAQIEYHMSTLTCTM